MDEPPSYSFTELILGDNLPYLITTVVFLFLAALISASEAAFFSLTPEQVESFRKAKSRRERVLSDLLTTPRLLLAVLTTWKYIMLICCAVLFTIAISFTEKIGTIIESSILTFFFALAAVIIPKVYGSSRSINLATTVSGVCNLLVRLTTPIVRPLLDMSIRVERKLEEMSEESSVKELTQALELAASEKDTTEDEKQILRGIVNFGTLTVADIMRPQIEINSVDSSLHFHDLLIYIKKSGFSRIPVYNNDMNKIEGVLYIKDLLPYLNEGRKFGWQKLLRAAYYVPESKKIDLLLKDFQEKRVHMALAIDESGSVAGIITLEDIIEEIIGDIHDEFDEVGAYYKKLDERTFIVDSKIPFLELCRVLDVDPSLFPQYQNENETLGAVLAELQEELPRIGDLIQLDPFTFIIEAIDHKRIKKLRVHIHEEKEH